MRGSRIIIQVFQTYEAKVIAEPKTAPSEFVTCLKSKLGVDCVLFVKQVPTNLMLHKTGVPTEQCISYISKRLFEFKIHIRAGIRLWNRR